MRGCLSPVRYPMGCHREYRKKLLQRLTHTTFEEIGLCQVLLAKQLSWSEFCSIMKFPIHYKREVG
jgi:hypothetical protein